MLHRDNSSHYSKIHSLFSEYLKFCKQRTLPIKYINILTGFREESTFQGFVGAQLCAQRKANPLRPRVEADHLVLRGAWRHPAFSLTHGTGEANYYLQIKLKS